jgi:hypothetical protein
VTEDPFASDEWQRFVEHTQRETVTQIAGAGAVLSIVPESGKADIKLAVELGLGIWFDKPLVILVHPGQEIPNKLRQVADAVVEADIDTEDGKLRLMEALDRLGLRRDT